MTTNWRVSDRIQGRWEVHKILRGGMGIVYVVYDHEFGEPLAAKTFQDDVLVLRPGIAERFTREALVWVRLDRHPFITQARFVETIENKPFLFLEYVAAGDLRAWIGTPRLTGDLRQVLRFAIQFCDAMIHAWSKGVKVHRDIKPANCLVSRDNTLKVTDFGLAKAFDDPNREPDRPSARPADTAPGGFPPPAGDGAPRESYLGATTVLSGTGEWMGTVTHMAPEQFADAKHVDVRADVYSFGVLLFQMVTGQLPFRGRTALELRHLHETELPPPLPDQHQELGSLIQDCLAKAPEDRFPDFRSVKERLTGLWASVFHEPPPQPPGGTELDALDWTNKGASLAALSRIGESVACHERALQLSPDFALAHANKGSALAALGKHTDALASLEKALALDPSLPEAWTNQGIVLDAMGRSEDALASYERALQLNPRRVDPWLNKGNHMLRLQLPEEALQCYDRAVSLDSRNPMAWYNKALALAEELGRHRDALVCLDQVLTLDPDHVDAWIHRGNSLWELSAWEESVGCYDRALAIDPEAPRAWFNKANALAQRGLPEEAVRCFERYLEFNPRDSLAWTCKGNALRAQRRCDEALACYERAIDLAPDDAGPWLEKGVALEALGQTRDALAAYDRALRVEPGMAQAWSNKGNALWALGDTRGALACQDRAIELNPNSGNAWFNKGAIILNDLHDHRAALECFEHALRSGFAPAGRAVELCREALHR